MSLLARCSLSVFLVLSVSAAEAVEWHELKSDHFIVYYKKAPFGFVEKTDTKAEENYKRTAATLGFIRYKGWLWGDRAKIYLYDDVEDYRKSSGLGWAAGSVQTGSKSISAYPSAQGFFDTTLPHEIGHIIFRDFVGMRAVVPLWFEEGIAMYQEDSGHWSADDAVRRLIDERQFISIADLMRLELGRDSDRELVRVFYAEAASLVGFLINKGEMYRFARLCRELKSGELFEPALKKSYMIYH